MTQLHLTPFGDLPEDLRERAAASLEATGDDRFLRAVASAPHMADFYFRDFYEGVFFGGVVPLSIKELVRLRLSNLHGCVY